MGAMHEFRILDPNGHARTAWDPEMPDEVDKARRLLDELLRRGYRAFRVADKETLFVPPIHGG